MKIELKFTDSDARRMQNFLRKKYNSKAELKALVKLLLLQVVAEQAQIDLTQTGIELDNLENEWNERLETIRLR